MSDLKAFLFVNLGLLPGEIGLTAAIMAKEGGLNTLNLLCAVGICITVNFFITAGFQNHVAAQKAAEKQSERIENS